MNTITYKNKHDTPQLINVQEFKSDYGRMLAAFNNDNNFLLFLGFPSSKQQAISELKKRFPQSSLKPVSFYSNPISQSSSLSIELYGTVFQHKVWKVLLNIPAGSTHSYQSIAQQIKKPTSYRAVGNAVGANPISILVPCHRVLPTSQKVGNYHWGSDIKKQLLKSESAAFL